MANIKLLEKFIMHICIFGQIMKIITEVNIIKVEIIL